MTTREELHHLINALEAEEVKRHMHVLAEEIDEETAGRTVSRIREWRRALSRLGWSL